MAGGVLEAVLSVLASVGVGAASALIPLVNAEAYVVVLSVQVSSWWLLSLGVVGLAVGQTVGKVAYLEAGRRARAPRWLARRMPSTTPARTARHERMRDLLRRPRTGVPLVLASAAVGLPPLAVVSVLAGAAGQRRTVFAVCCLAGRLVRFGVLVLPAGLV